MVTNRFERAGGRFALLISLMTAAIGPAAAEDFTFRRVTVAPSGSGPRITVQIDPAEQARRIAPPVTTAAPSPQRNRESDAPAGATPAGARYSWFWDRVSPDRNALEGRYGLAMEALLNPPEGGAVRQPGLQRLARIAGEHGSTLLAATIGTRVSPALALAVISVESAGRTEAQSHAGAQGLMQLIPATAERFGVTNSLDPVQNIRGGVAYLDWLLGEFDNDIVLALAGYNAGEGAVRRNNGVPPFSETRDYVPLVLSAWSVAQGLCRTRPQLHSDGCVFLLPGGEGQTAGASPEQVSVQSRATPNPNGPNVIATPSIIERP